MTICFWAGEAMLYIAYGSNINFRQMAHRCPGARVVGSAELAGYDLLFKGRRYSAAATVEPLDGGRVPVLLWDISKAHERSLDVYEGWPNVYRKEVHKVSVRGKTRQGMLYVMNNAYFGSPAASYYTTIREGYKHAARAGIEGFDISYLDRAVEQSRQMALEQDRERFEQDFDPGMDDDMDFDGDQQRLHNFDWW